MHHALRILRERGIPRRIVKAGDHLTGGDVVLKVLHPPAPTATRTPAVWRFSFDTAGTLYRDIPEPRTICHSRHRPR
ncbi:MAG TPA: hypothetical protein VMF69_11530 [Gemmataceae bacterium]|nr:hypothetical protein [Gemmataceae bacterium]